MAQTESPFPNPNSSSFSNQKLKPNPHFLTLTHLQSLIKCWSSQSKLQGTLQSATSQHNCASPTTASSFSSTSRHNTNEAQPHLFLHRATPPTNGNCDSSLSSAITTASSLLHHCDSSLLLQICAAPFSDLYLFVVVGISHWVLQTVLTSCRFF